MAKNYVGKGWQVKGYDMINIELNIHEINKLPVDPDWNTVKITIGKRKEIDGKSQATHSVWENDYKKEPQGEQTRTPDRYTTAEEIKSDLPF